MENNNLVKKKKSIIHSCSFSDSQTLSHGCKELMGMSAIKPNHSYSSELLHGMNGNRESMIL